MSPRECEALDSQLIVGFGFGKRAKIHRGLSGPVRRQHALGELLKQARPVDLPDIGALGQELRAICASPCGRKVEIGDTQVSIDSARTRQLTTDGEFAYKLVMFAPQPVDFEGHADPRNAQPVAIITYGGKLPRRHSCRPYRRPHLPEFLLVSRFQHLAHVGLLRCHAVAFPAAGAVCFM